MLTKREQSDVTCATIRPGDKVPGTRYTLVRIVRREPGRMSAAIGLWRCSCGREFQMRFSSVMNNSAGRGDERRCRVCYMDESRQARHRWAAGKTAQECGP